jgi:hypothetical protein
MKYIYIYLIDDSSGQKANGKRLFLKRRLFGFCPGYDGKLHPVMRSAPWLVAGFGENGAAPQPSLLQGEIHSLALAGNGSRRRRLYPNSQPRNML